MPEKVRALVVVVRTLTLPNLPLAVVFSLPVFVLDGCTLTLRCIPSLDVRLRDGHQKETLRCKGFFLIISFAYRSERLYLEVRTVLSLLAFLLHF